MIDLALKKTIFDDDPLPEDILYSEKYLPLTESLQEIHFPTTEKKLQTASSRLKFQELFYLQCKYQLAKKEYQEQSSFVITVKQDNLDKYLDNLPFKLTKDQKKTNFIP